jgi:OmpA-OmpF porin, OOP family
MHAIIRSGLVAALLAAALPAFADEGMTPQMAPYVGDSGQYILNTLNRHSGNGGYGDYVGGGVPVNQFFNLELGGYYNTFHPNDDFGGLYKWHTWGGRFDTQFFYSRNPAFSPYFAVGVGEERDNLRTVPVSFSSLFADAGFGAIHYFKIGDIDAGIRADARYRYVALRDKYPDQPLHHFGEPVFSVGLVFPIGAHAATEAAPPPAPAPLPPPVARKPSAPVENPNRKFDDVHFAFNQSNLSDYARASLDSDVGVISQLTGHYPSLKVDVSGHTDWVGTDAYNQALSERRAATVKEYLVRKGVDAGRIRTFAYGESQPVAPNTTAEGRALNRRAEIRTNASE